MVLESKSVVNSLTFMCLLLRRSLFCLSLHVLYVISTAVQHVFQCGVKQQKAPDRILGGLEGVAPTIAQVGCGQTLSLHVVVLGVFLKISPV